MANCLGSVGGNARVLLPPRAASARLYPSRIHPASPTIADLRAERVSGAHVWRLNRTCQHHGVMPSRRSAVNGLKINPRFFRAGAYL